jgi:ATP-dependent DNA helicase 2 subunit 1
MHEWGLLLDAEAEAHAALHRVKHDLDDDGPGPVKKKIKAASKALAELSREEQRAASSNGGLAKFTVAELKDFCVANRLAVAGKKADLVERIEEFMEV